MRNWILFYSISCCLFLVGCEERYNQTPGSSSSSTATSSLSQYQQTDTSNASKRTYSNIDADRALKEWLASANQSVVFVDNSLPEWLPVYMAQLKQKKPYLTSIFITRVPFQEYYGARGYTVPQLKASYIILDRSYVIINPIFDSATRGIMLVQSDQTALNDYLRYSSWLIGVDL